MRKSKIAAGLTIADYEMLKSIAASKGDPVKVKIYENAIEKMNRVGAAESGALLTKALKLKVRRRAR